MSRIGKLSWWMEKNRERNESLETPQTYNDFSMKVMEINISESAWLATTLRGLHEYRILADTLPPDTAAVSDLNNILRNLEKR